MPSSSGPSHPLIVVTETLDPKPAAWLAERSNLVWCSHEKNAELDALLPEVDALVVRTYTRVDASLLEKARKLRVVARAGVGLDNIDLPACTARGVRVVFTPDANTQAVVEYVTGLMLDHVRPRPRMNEKGSWTATEFHQIRKTAVGLQLNEMTLGIVGFGRIGQRLGRVAAVLGMKVLATDILPPVHFASIEFDYQMVGPAELLKRSDIVTLHADGRPENAGMINREFLAGLKPSALFINAARGMLVDSVALADWARGAHATGGAAILDVHEPEPPDLAYPLYNLPNVWLLPHLASRTGQALENMSWVVRDVMEVLEGRRPRFPANELDYS